MSMGRPEPKACLARTVFEVPREVIQAGHPQGIRSGQHRHAPVAQRRAVGGAQHEEGEQARRNRLGIERATLRIGERVHGRLSSCQMVGRPT